MADLLRRLAARALGKRELVRPRLGPRFGPEPMLAEDPRPRLGPAAPAAKGRGRSDANDAEAPRAASASKRLK